MTQKKYNNGKTGRYHIAGFEEDVTSRMIYSGHTQSSGCASIMAELTIAMLVIVFLAYAWSQGWIHISLPF